MMKEITQPKFFSVCDQMREFYPNCSLDVGYFEDMSGNGGITFHLLAKEPGCRVVVFGSSLNQPEGGYACANILAVLKSWLEQYVSRGAS